MRHAWFRSKVSLGALALAASAACGLSVQGMADPNVDATLPGVLEASASDGADGSAPGNMRIDGSTGPDAAVACATCSQKCPTACAGRCSSGTACLSLSSASCVNDCGKNCPNAPSDCTVCSPDGGRVSVCGDDLCNVGALTCPCTKASDCPDEHDVCIRGKCARCGFGGASGGTAGLTCKCSTCNGTQCDGC